ncbi:MAG: FIG007808: N-acetyltransferase, partial [uncultured Nocardioidaceae bacterium]
GASHRPSHARHPRRPARERPDLPVLGARRGAPATCPRRRRCRVGEGGVAVAGPARVGVVRESSLPRRRAGGFRRLRPARLLPGLGVAADRPGQRGRRAAGHRPGVRGVRRRRAGPGAHAGHGQGPPRARRRSCRRGVRDDPHRRRRLPAAGGLPAAGRVQDPPSARSGAADAAGAQVGPDLARGDGVRAEPAARRGAPEPVTRRGAAGGPGSLGGRL